MADIVKRLEEVASSSLYSKQIRTLCGDAAFFMAAQRSELDSLRYALKEIAKSREELKTLKDGTKETKETKDV